MSNGWQREDAQHYIGKKSTRKKEDIFMSVANGDKCEERFFIRVTLRGSGVAYVRSTSPTCRTLQMEGRASHGYRTSTLVDYGRFSLFFCLGRGGEKKRKTAPHEFLTEGSLGSMMFPFRPCILSNLLTIGVKLLVRLCARESASCHWPGIFQYSYRRAGWDPGNV